MSKIIRRLRDAPNEAMKPIVQELEDLASVAEGRFTAGIKVKTIQKIIQCMLVSEFCNRTEARNVPFEQID